MKKNNPQSAIISITNQCNSRCLACDIWKKQNDKHLSLNVIKKLPQGLKDIDLTGGEPFLHPELPGIVKILKKNHPSVRLLITTNGLLPQKIKKIIPALVREDKNLAVRVSLDGMEETHDKMRGIKGAFRKAIKSLKVLKQSGVKDLGIIFTLTKVNKNEIKKILNFCKEEKLNFSLNLVCDSPIYFGQNHLSLIPNKRMTTEVLKKVAAFFKSPLPLSNMAKRWFYEQTINYIKIGKRPLKCGAGENFFYVDPEGNVYPCHLKNWLIGDLNKQSFKSIWRSHKKKEFSSKAEQCGDCFLICTSKEQIKKNKMKVISQLFCLGK